ncbi:MAG: hypothetical protein GY859_18280, partial [Desulfobacterales bacterium]|nr:hypothetical protein [Desulfobacterales bacterium]
WMVKHHDKKEESPFRRLADLTRKSESPFLRVAHSIRDIAYGDRSRVEDLKNMAQSDHPVYRKLFEDALWRPTAEEEEKENQGGNNGRG